MNIERTLAVPDGISCYVVRPTRPSTGSVVVLAELFGMTPHVLALCDHLAAAGLEVVCPDLFHRAPGAVVLPENDRGRMTGFAALRDLTVDQLLHDVEAAASVLSGSVEHAGLLGLSVGGYVGFHAAARMPFGRAALAYPGWLSSSTPPIDHHRPALDDLPGVTGQLLVIVGSDDSLIDSDEQHLLAERLASPHELLVVPGAGHGFLSPTRPAYDAPSADDAWERIVAHLT